MWDAENRPLFGNISVNMARKVEEEGEGEFDEQPLLGMSEEEPMEAEDPCAPTIPSATLVTHCTHKCVQAHSF